MSSDYRLMQQQIEFNLDLDATLHDRTYMIARSTIAEGNYILQSCCPADVGYVNSFFAGLVHYTRANSTTVSSGCNQRN